jgi:hypothetical protein
MMPATLPPMLAYLDAGSASAIVTLILGGIAGVGVALRHRWRQLLVALKLRKPVEEDPPAERAP